MKDEALEKVIKRRRFALTCMEQCREEAEDKLKCARENLGTSAGSNRRAREEHQWHIANTDESEAECKNIRFRMFEAQKELNALIEKAKKDTDAEVTENIQAAQSKEEATPAENQPV